MYLLCYQDGPLDMRMGQGGETNKTSNNTESDIGSSIDASTITTGKGLNTLTASDICNEWDSGAIADLLYQFGDETNVSILWSYDLKEAS